MAAEKPTTSNSIVSKIDFVDDQSADVLLTLVPLTSGNAIGPLKLHSSVLQQAEYFKVQLSERWTFPTKRAEIELKICKDAAVYIRFFELLYMPKEKRHFSNLEEALDMLEIAEQLLWEDCRNSCMDYVERSPWTSEQEEVIRSCFSSLNRTPSADLSLRLSHAWDLSPDSLKAMIHACLDLADLSIASLMLQNLQAASFADVVDDALFQKLQIKMRNCWDWEWDCPWKLSRDCMLIIKELSWYIDTFRELNIASTAFKVFAEAPSGFISNFCSARSDLLSDFVNDLDLFFGNLCNEKVVVSQAVRAAVVTKWFPVFVKRLAKEDNPNRDWLERTVESLPCSDQCTIFSDWIKRGASKSDRLAEPFAIWCRKLKCKSSSQISTCELEKSLPLS